MTLEEIITAAANRYGVDPEVLLQKARVESSMDPKAYNKGSKASGLFQFIPGTAKDYGLRDPFDPYEAADAAARLTRDDAKALRQALGRDASPEELYLAHQQGRAGATRLLANPNAPAAALVGKDAVTGNRGSLAMTAGDFVKHIFGQYGGKAGNSRAHPIFSQPDDPELSPWAEMADDGGDDEGDGAESLGDMLQRAAAPAAPAGPAPVADPLQQVMQALNPDQAAPGPDDYVTPGSAKSPFNTATPQQMAAAKLRSLFG